MKENIKNPYGQEIEVLFDGMFYKAFGKNGEAYISEELEAVIGAFINDVLEDKQTIHNSRNMTTYISSISDRLTKMNDGIPAYMILRNENYLT